MAPICQGLGREGSRVTLAWAAATHADSSVTKRASGLEDTPPEPALATSTPQDLMAAEALPQYDVFLMRSEGFRTRGPARRGAAKHRLASPRLEVDAENEFENPAAGFDSA